MTTTQTSTYTVTRTHTATHLTDVIMGAISDILADLNINPAALYHGWARDEAAIKAWIEEGSLAAVVLECHQPRGAVSPVIEFPVSYTSTGTGDAAFTASRARLARFRAKLDQVPAGTTFQLFVTYNGYHSPQPGWGPGTRASTQGMSSINFGTLGSAPHAAAGMRYHHS